MKNRRRIIWLTVFALTAGMLAALFWHESETEAAPIEWESRVWTDAWGVPYLFLPSWYQGPVEENVNILYSANVPSVAITTESASMENFKVSKEIRETGTITIVDEEGNLTYSGELSEIRARGNMTFCLEKQPYQLKLKQPADLLEMGNAGTWLLLADFVDESGIRNVIALDMAKAAGMEYVPAWRAVDLYCNGTYWGSYLLTEKIEVKTNRMDIADGFLLERDLAERWEQEEYGFVTAEGDHYVQHYPESGRGMERAQRLIEAFEAAVKQPDGRNPQTDVYYTEYIDLDSFAKKYVLEEVLLNYDAGATSAYYYIKADGTIYAGPPWDYDSAMGNCFVTDLVQDPETLALGKQHAEGTSLYEYLWGHDDFRQRVAEIYEADFRPFIEELLNGGIDSYTEYFLASGFMNYVRWRYSINPNKYYLSYANDLRYLKYFFDTREKFLDQLWLQTVNEEDRSFLWKTGETHLITYEVDGEIWRTEEVEDGALLESLPFPDGYEDQDVAWKRKGNELDVYLKRPVFEDETWFLYGIDNQNIQEYDGEVN